MAEASAQMGEGMGTFAFGALSASMIWCCIGVWAFSANRNTRNNFFLPPPPPPLDDRQQKRAATEQEEDEEIEEEYLGIDEVSVEEEDVREFMSRRSSSLIEVILSSSQMLERMPHFLPSFETFQILTERSAGVMKERMRWPWDRIRRSMASVSSNQNQSHQFTDPHNNNNNNSNKNSSTAPETTTDSTQTSALHQTDQENDQENDPTSDLCIGSIFGMDVGGTLAKLVYFEKDDTNNFNKNGPQSASSSSQLPPLTRPSSATTVAVGSEHNEVLRARAMVRQASLPDNLHAYADDYYISPPTPSSSTLNPLSSSSLSSIPLLPSLYSNHSTHEHHEEKKETTIMDQYPPPLSPKQPDIKKPTMQRSKSMFDISRSIEHAELLDRFYSFVRSLDDDDYAQTAVRDTELSFRSRRFAGGEFHFIRFETSRMPNAIHLIRKHKLHRNIGEMGATGGGAHKYEDDLHRQLGIVMTKHDELDSLVAGMQFVLGDVVGECYSFQPHHLRQPQQRQPSPPPPAVTFTVPFSHKTPTSSTNTHATPTSTIKADSTDEKIPHNPALSLTTPTPRTYSSSSSSSSSTTSEASEPKVDEWWWSRKVVRDVATDAETYPYLLVTIGTGVSILRVDGPRKHVRISGSTIGGGTYWGLCRLLTDAADFEHALRLAERGDPTKVDMMVGDIYGKNSGALEKLGLASNIVASSFGKLVAKANPAQGLKQEDLARALLLMVTNNIGQVAHLNARLHGMRRIFFVGNFLRHNIISQQRLAYAIHYWSQGDAEALFLKHEGYFGALGAFLLNQNNTDNSNNSNTNVPTTNVPTTNEADANNEEIKSVKQRQQQKQRLTDRAHITTTIAQKKTTTTTKSQQSVLSHGDQHNKKYTSVPSSSMLSISTNDEQIKQQQQIPKSQRQRASSL